MATGNIIHIGAIRVRIITGVGNLVATLYDLNGSNNSFAPAPIVMSTNASEPTRLTNLNTQKGMLRLEIDNINETFMITRITIFYSPLWTSYPT